MTFGATIFKDKVGVIRNLSDHPNVIHILAIVSIGRSSIIIADDPIDSPFEPTRVRRFLPASA